MIPLESKMENYHQQQMNSSNNSSSSGKGEKEEETIMAALSTLNPNQLSDLTYSLSTEFRHQHHRLHSLLTSPARFSLTLQLLKSLSLHQKSLLIARYLLTTLKQLTCVWDVTPFKMIRTRLSSRDADAISLLFLLCEVHQHHPHTPLHTSPMANWPSILKDYVLKLTLSLSTGISSIISPTSTTIVLSTYIDMVIKCRRFLKQACHCSRAGRGGNKARREVGASVAAVVSLNSVEVGGDDSGEMVERASPLECVICKEEMVGRRDVCELPCQHFFHWKCVLPWLNKSNTCPCCRFQLPTDDLFGEIDRLWGILVRKSCSLDR